MSNEDVGKYIRTLCLLHQHGGYLPKIKIEKITEQLPDVVLEKLSIGENGDLYSKRLSEEFDKRKAFCDSRRKNIQKRYIKPTSVATSVAHMENENENRDAINLGTKKSKPQNANEVSIYAESIGFSIDAEGFIDHYEANGWFRGKTKIKDWKACVRTWKKNKENNSQTLTPAQKRTVASHKKWKKRMADEERNT